ncbi:hypothetical protein PCLA_13r0210 [Pseudomonas citronellolis]|nr:hypothetical protein PCLA_13r0210 [Pseudomonas citronellolis]
MRAEGHDGGRHRGFTPGCEYVSFASLPDDNRKVIGLREKKFRMVLRRMTLWLS